MKKKKLRRELRGWVRRARCLHDEVEALRGEVEELHLREVDTRISRTGHCEPPPPGAEQPYIMPGSVIRVADPEGAVFLRIEVASITVFKDDGRSAVFLRGKA